MRRLYQATFSNGVSIRRETVSRTYTHAYLTFGQYVGRDGATREWRRTGFSSSKDQAYKNMKAESASLSRHAKPTFAEVVAVEQIK